jgi:dihydrofolate reductase
MENGKAKMDGGKVSFSIVVAVDQNYGIGKTGKMPWHLSGDMEHFKKLTLATSSLGKKNVVVMGRKTWDSLPEKFKPLPGRINLVLSRQKELRLPDSVKVAGGLEEALVLVAQMPGNSVEKVFVIGGAEVYQEALRHPQCQAVYLTRILKDFECDVFFPKLLKGFKNVSVVGPIMENGLSYSFEEYRRI